MITRIIKERIISVLKNTPIWRFRLKMNEIHMQKRMQKRKKFFHLEAEELLEKFSQTLNSANVLFWLDFGTLLGYYREHDFIKHDFDLDCGVFLKDAGNVRKSLTENGFKLIREFKSLKDGGMEECYLYKHTSIDIFYYRTDSVRNTIYCNSFSTFPELFKGINKKAPAEVKRIDLPKSEFQKVTYKNSTVNVPDNPVLYLQRHYGADFMTPNPDFDYKKEATNITYYRYEDMPGEYIIHKII